MKFDAKNEIDILKKAHGELIIGLGASATYLTAQSQCDQELVMYSNLGVLSKEKR